MCHSLKKRILGRGPEGENPPPPCKLFLPICSDRALCKTSPKKVIVKNSDYFRSYGPLKSEKMLKI